MAMLVGILSVPAVPLSIVGYLILRSSKVTPFYAASLPIGMTLGLLGAVLFDFAVQSSHPFLPSWLVLTLGAGAGACWGVLAPSLVRTHSAA
jgi:hypothetical protein